MSVRPVKVGVIGCGATSDAYFKANTTFEILDFVACAERTRIGKVYCRVRPLT